MTPSTLYAVFINIVEFLLNCGVSPILHSRGIPNINIYKDLMFNDWLFTRKIKRGICNVNWKYMSKLARRLRSHFWYFCIKISIGISSNYCDTLLLFFWTILFYGRNKDWQIDNEVIFYICRIEDILLMFIHLLHQ